MLRVSKIGLATLRLISPSRLRPTAIYLPGVALVIWGAAVILFSHFTASVFAAFRIMKFTSMKRFAGFVFASFLLLSSVQAQSPRRPSSMTGFDDVVMAISFSPDGRALAIARGAAEAVQRVGRVELWSTETGELLHSINGFDGPVWSVSFSPDGKTLVTGSSEYHSEKIQQTKRSGHLLAEVKWWDPITGDLKNKLTLPEADRLSLMASYSPQGGLIATVERYMESSLTMLSN